MNASTCRRSGLIWAYAGLGDKEQAFAILERSFEERRDRMVWLNVDPLLDRSAPIRASRTSYAASACPRRVRVSSNSLDPSMRRAVRGTMTGKKRALCAWFAVSFAASGAPAVEVKTGSEDFTLDLGP